MPEEKQESKALASRTRTSRVHPNAAGIDLGSRSHFVALPQNRGQDVREFGCFTEDLNDMASWLLAHQIDTIAMEATGAYWIPVYQVLEGAGLDVQLVNPYHYSNVPGRKTDVQDCQWLQYLHECGLVRGSFRPKDAVCVLRAYERQRQTWIEESSRHMQRMQKALEQMNIQLHKVLTSIMGASGVQIIKDIVDGERDPHVLARHRNRGCKRSPEDFVKALTGDWREEHLFCLGQEFRAYQFAEQNAAACTEAFKEGLAKLEAKIEPPADLKTPRETDRQVQRLLYQATGIDLLATEGFGQTVATRLISEIGVDMTPWQTEQHFTSWARVCPRNNITGGKRRRAGGKPRPSRISQIFKQAAYGLANAKSGLGAYYRRIRQKRGPKHANAVTAHKLARIFYRIMKHGEAYRRYDAEQQEARYNDAVCRGAVKRLEKLGFHVELKQEVPLPA